MKEVREPAIQICQGQAFQERVQQVQRPCGRSVHSLPREGLVAASVWVWWRGADDEAKDLGIIC